MHPLQLQRRPRLHTPDSPGATLFSERPLSWGPYVWPVHTCHSLLLPGCLQELCEASLCDFLPPMRNLMYDPSTGTAHLEALMPILVRAHCTACHAHPFAYIKEM